MVIANCLKYITLQIKKQTNQKKLTEYIARASWWIFKNHTSEGFKAFFPPPSLYPSLQSTYRKKDKMILKASQRI